MGDEKLDALIRAIAAFRDDTATFEQLHLLEDALFGALRLFMAMGEPSATVPYWLAKALDSVRTKLAEDLDEKILKPPTLLEPCSLTEPRTYTISSDGRSITFEPCGVISYSPKAVEIRFCPLCYWIE